MQRLSKEAPARQPISAFVLAVGAALPWPAAAHLELEREAQQGPMVTMTASTARLCSVGSTATVPMMSAITRRDRQDRAQDENADTDQLNDPAGFNGQFVDIHGAILLPTRG